MSQDRRKGADRVAEPAEVFRVRSMMWENQLQIDI